MKNNGNNRKLALLLAALLAAAALFTACLPREYEGGRPAATPDGEGGEAIGPAATGGGTDVGNLKPGDDPDDGTVSHIHGKTMDYGIYTGLFIPDSMDFTAGTLVDPSSQEGFLLADRSDPTRTISFAPAVDAEADLDERLETYAADEPEEIAFELGENTWTGCFYKHNGLDGFLLYTVNGSRTIMCESTGYPIDSAFVKEILASVKFG